MPSNSNIAGPSSNASDIPRSALPNRSQAAIPPSRIPVNNFTPTSTSSSARSAPFAYTPALTASVPSPSVANVPRSIHSSLSSSELSEVNMMEKALRPFDCEWEDCDATLHTWNSLRRHLEVRHCPKLAYANGRVCGPLQIHSSRVLIVQQSCSIVLQRRLYATGVPAWISSHLSTLFKHMSLLTSSHSNFHAHFLVSFFSMNLNDTLTC
jgi:hypothetical protein